MDAELQNVPRILTMQYQEHKQLEAVKGLGRSVFNPHRCRCSSLVMSSQAHPETPGARWLVRPVTPRDYPSKTKTKHDQGILLISMLKIHTDIKKEKNYFMVKYLK